MFLHTMEQIHPLAVEQNSRFYIHIFYEVIQKNNEHVHINDDMFYVYILHLENGQLYHGFTRNLRKRIEKHLQGAVPTTNRIRPDDLVFCAAFKNEKKALEFERYLKSSSGFAFRNKRLV